MSVILITSNLLRHGFCFHVTHHFLTSPLISLYNYLTEFNNKTSDNRTNPNGNCIFLSTAELTNMAFKFTLIAYTVLMKKQKHYFHLPHKNLNTTLHNT